MALFSLYEVEISCENPDQNYYDPDAQDECILDPYGEHVYQHETCHKCQPKIHTIESRYPIPSNFSMEDINECGYFVKYDKILSKLGFTGDTSRVMSVSIKKKKLSFKEEMIYEISK